MRRSISRNEVANPERVMHRMVRDYISGRFDNNQVLYRACVVAVDQEGGQFEDDPPNPRNTLQARIITKGLDATTIDDDFPIFWPMFPHMQLPVKEGEHVYVMFEDGSRRHGLWLTRIPVRNDVDSANYVEGTAPYLKSSDEVSATNVDRLVAGTSDDPTRPEISEEFTVENVRPFVSRVGDYVIEGSNGTLIVLGRDRPGDRDSGIADEAGTIDIVVGRVTDDDMDSKNDKSRVYVSQKTDADKNFGTDAYGGTADAGTSAGESAAIVHISDQIRIIARDNMKIVVTGGDLTIEGTNINIGTKAQEHAVLGDTLKSLLDELITALSAHTHPTPAGPSANCLDPNASKWTEVQGNLAKALSTTVKVKG